MRAARRRRRRVGLTLCLAWLAAAATLGLWRGNAVAVAAVAIASDDDYFEPGFEDDEDGAGAAAAPAVPPGLVRARLRQLPGADRLRAALLDLFEGAAPAEAEALPLYVDADGNVWVEHRGEFYAVLPEYDYGEEDIPPGEGEPDALPSHDGEGDGDASWSFLDHSRPSDEGGVAESEGDASDRSHRNAKADSDAANEADRFQGLPAFTFQESAMRPDDIEQLERSILTEFFADAWRESTSKWTKIDDSKHICQYRGVLCEHRVSLRYTDEDGDPAVYQVVTRLELVNSNLQATLPASFAQLRHLSVLNLAGNSLHGSLPQEYVNMSTALYYFDVGDNNLTGTMPEGFLSTSTDLQEIRLNHNSLSGTLPSGTPDWKFFKVLDLAENFFTGTIPTRLGLLQNIQYLILGNNFITGTIPSVFQDLNYLYTLDFGSNFIEDTLERIMPLLPTRLLDVNLENNLLHGTFSEQVFARPQLEVLLLSHNYLTGALPSALGTPTWSVLSNLRMLHLTDNRFSGTLPASMFTGLKTGIESLKLGQNQFSGTIPEEIGDLSSLMVIDAMSNKLRGTLPSSMLQLNRNLRFNFTDNLLTGTIPGLFCGEGATSTSMLYQENGCDAVLCRPGTFNIHGHATLHACCRPCPSTEHGESQDPPLSRILGRTDCEGVAYVHGDLNGDGILSPREILRMLYIDTLGRFWGPSFQNWANMSHHECDLEGVTCFKRRIVKLDLTSANMCSDGNRKPGPTSYCKGLPAEIGELKHLETLQLSRRQFLRGSLPTEVGRLTNLRTLDVSSCVWMTGTLPTELGLLNQMKTLKISHTQIRGTIPSELFALSSLEVLHLTNNKLTGTLPPTRLPRVKELMIARNWMKGTLPTEIGELKQLENFEGYHNDFTGSLPTEFGSCSLLKRIDLFSNKFTGSIPNSLLNIEPLQILHLKGNQLTGTIPDLGRLPRMSWIDLSGNHLHGTVPPSLGANPEIEDLRLGGNMLYEPLPRGLCANPHVNGGATKLYGCDGVLCPLGTFSENSGHASEAYGPCEPCPPGETTLYLGSLRSGCRRVSPAEVLTMFYEVMRGGAWPAEARRNWGDLATSVCDWAGIACDASGEMTGLAFPLIGLDDYQ